MRRAVKFYAHRQELFILGKTVKIYYFGIEMKKLM